MKLVIIEPLGVEEEKLMEIAHKALPDSVEIVSYQTKVTDTESLIERGKDADIIMVANLPLNAEVIKGCKNLQDAGGEHLQGFESYCDGWYAKNREITKYATVQAIQMLQFQTLSLDF